MKKRLSFFAATIVGLAAVLGIEPATAASIDAVERASTHDDLAALQTERSAIVTADSPYLAALADYRIGIAQSVRADEKGAKAALESASDILESLVAERPGDAEAWALLANAYGMRMGLSPFSAMKLSGKAKRARKQALALAPNNPRVLLMEGIALHNTPSMWGGSKTGAIEVLGRAIDAFDTAAKPGWGHAEALVWRGLSYADTGDAAAAEGDFTRAVELEPDYAWAQSLLSRQRAVAKN